MSYQKDRVVSNAYCAFTPTATKAAKSPEVIQD